MQRESVTAFVTAVVAKPSFACKPISGVVNLPALPSQLLQLGLWLQQYYPAPLGLVAQQLTPAISKVVANESATNLPAPVVNTLPALTAEQAAATEQIVTPDTYLVHGKTGSGKTRLYIELAVKTISSGRSALVLTPEISLTSQLTQRLQAVFGERVILLHSRLTPVERRTAWQRLLTSKEPLVVVGPRSALFSPLNNIGLIILDESHEPAYKQEQAPHYQAGRVAAKLRQLHDAILVLGSATPSIGDYHEAVQRGKAIIRLEQLAISSEASVSTTIVDLKDHSLFPRSMYISEPLQAAIHGALAAANKHCYI